MKLKGISKALAIAVSLGVGLLGVTVYSAIPNILAEGTIANSKLFDVVLAFAVARLWPGVPSNAVDPGWVPTKMGGPSAPDDPEQGVATQVWLAVSDERDAKVSGRHFYHKRTRAAHPAASDVTVQNGFLAACEQLTGVRLASAVTT